jgi:hypothetical protein
MLGMQESTFPHISINKILTEPHRQLDAADQCSSLLLTVAKQVGVMH